MKNNNSLEVSLLTDKQWSIIDGEVCRVTDFDNTISKLGKLMPYASITIECRKISNKMTGFITHKTDFINLQKAFDEKFVKEGIEKGDVEVLIIWTKKYYKNLLIDILSFLMPRLIIWICKKGAYELINYQDYKPELTGEARFLAEKPIIEWKSEVMR